jgi:8-oxo-dGTP pyrophosphatase MutT (NUDIX family)
MTELSTDFPNPWQTVSTQKIYENPWISLREDKVITPTGTSGIYGVVTMKAFAIGIIPLDEAHNTWLVGQYRYSLNEYCWEIPMGGGSKDVSLEESAQRELREETGLTAKKWTKLMKIHTSNSITDEEGYVFLAEDLSAGETAFDETEQLHIVKLPFKEVVAMVDNGKITDGISVAGILRLARLLGY